jgi:glycosyltransferase involved in cell wall biosynthesis
VPEIAARYPYIRYHAQPYRGLSVARNTGMELAEGEIIAYTDDDCFAEEDWLYFLVIKLLDFDASAVGGPNLLPTHDGPVAACVSASPGTPAHILIDDHIAEHIPGCNMAFWADRLKAIGGFDPLYTKAGDDVDVCWRLQAGGDTIVYNPRPWCGTTAALPSAPLSSSSGATARRRRCSSASTPRSSRDSAPTSPGTGASTPAPGWG